jgi:hypothetical protein
MSGDWFALWWPAFLSTVLVETPIVALFLRDRLGLGSALALGVALQCVTHPLFWLTWDLERAFFYQHYGAAVLGFEALVYLIEAAIIWAVLPPRQSGHRLPRAALALLASATANTVSLAVGMLAEG